MKEVKTLMTCNDRIIIFLELGEMSWYMDRFNENDKNYWDLMDIIKSTEIWWIL